MRTTQAERAGLEQAPDPTRRSLTVGIGLLPVVPLLPGCGGGAAADAPTSADAGLGVSGADAVQRPADPITAEGSDPVVVTPVDAPAAPSEPVPAAEPVVEAEQAPPPQRPQGRPALLHTPADLQRMRDKLAAKQQPWLGGWNALLGARRANLDATAYPLESVSRGVAGYENYGTMITDMVRAYHLGLRWHLSGDEAYAKDAVRFLNAWSSTLKELSGNSNLFLSSGLYGNQWANAAELMRDYPGWAAADKARFQDMLLKVFYTRCHDFLTTHNGSEVRKVTHYWANWDLANICGMYAIGVFCDRADIAAEALTYYKTGRGMGTSDHSVYYLHPGYLGQWQESHRDQGHSSLGIALAGMLCEMAWNQGEDLYGYANNRLLAGAEYVAKTNVSGPNGQPYVMPFTPYNGVQGPGTATSGTGNPRPCWELIYNHYVNRRGMAAPWTKAMVDKLRPEIGDGGDSVGFGSLLFARDPVPAVKPRGLTASLSGGKVLLSWWGSADATSYTVQRSGAASGPFAAVAEVTDPRTYSDTPAEGIWYYRIVAVTPGGERVGVDTLRVAVPGELWLHLPLNGDTNDLSGKGRHAQLAGTTSWGAGRNGGSAVQLDGRSGHVVLPTGAVAELGDFTMAVWVYWDTAVNAARIFDFGSTDVAYVALCPRGGNPSKMQVLASRNQWWPEQPLVADPVPAGRWVHVALTLSGTVGTLYLDGVASGSSDRVWMAPNQMGQTTRNWLGRSQYGGDPFFKGRMQDFRLYSGALSPERIAELAR